MAKNKDGSKRTYFQLADCVRVNGNPRNRVICNLGRADDPETQEKMKKMAESLMKATDGFHLLNLSEELKAEYGKEFGPFLVFKRLFSELGFDTILRSNFKDLKTDFDVIEALFNMMLNRLTDPGSKRQLTLWEDGVEGVKSFDLQQYYRALDYLKMRLKKMFSVRCEICFIQSLILCYLIRPLLFTTAMGMMRMRNQKMQSF